MMFVVMPLQPDNESQQGRNRCYRMLDDESIPSIMTGLTFASSAPPQQPDEQRLRLSSVSWESYRAISDHLEDRPIRVTFDRGEMEIMSLSGKHEKEKSRRRRFEDALTLGLEIDISSGGSMTCRNEEMLRALEPDECYWIANEPAVRELDEIDLDVDPPPDLSLEVEISRSTLNRMSIYAALKVPEVWRWDGETLSVHLLTSRGAYRISKRSKAFPFLPLNEFTAFLKRTDVSETRLLLAFTAWVRESRPAWKVA